MTDADFPLARREVREALQRLRDAGVTADQYANVELVEKWSVSGTEYINRAAAFCAAQEEADRTGKWAEVCLTYGAEADWAMAESWIVKPSGQDHTR